MSRVWYYVVQSSQLPEGKWESTAERNQQVPPMQWLWDYNFWTLTRPKDSQRCSSKKYESNIA